MNMLTAPAAALAVATACVVSLVNGATLYQTLNMSGKAITNMATPEYLTSPPDQAATKKYVDDMAVAGTEQFSVLTNTLSVNGVAGPTGPTGAQGAQGEAGPTGPTGRTGPTGATGAAGPSGFTGPNAIFGNAYIFDPTAPDGGDGSVARPFNSLMMLTTNNAAGIDWTDKTAILMPGTYIVHDEIILGATNLLIKGMGGCVAPPYAGLVVYSRAVRIISANDSKRIFTLAPACSFRVVTIEGVSVTSTNTTGDGGAVYVHHNYGRVNLRDCAFVSCYSSGCGGAVAGDSSGYVT